MPKTNPCQYTPEITRLMELAQKKLLALGDLGTELAHPPDDAEPLWVYGTLMASEAHICDLKIIQQAAQMLIREGF